MKLILPAFSLVLCVFISDAQTANPIERKSVRIKSYTLPPTSDFNTWDIGGHIGLTYPHTDISASSKRDFAFGIDVTKFLSHSFALQTRFMHASISGIDENKPEYQFNSTIDYDLTLNAVIQIGNISFLKRIPDFALYGSVGFGLVHFTPDVFIDGGHEALTGIYSQYSQPLDTMDYQGTTNVMIPFGIGAKYRISKNLSITGEYSYRSTNSDKLDGFYKLLSDRDSYSYFNIGCTWHIGSQSKVLEWENPLQSVYNDLYDMKEKIDLASKDSDDDGVADLFDKEPNTPHGSKVYGDGTSVDSDGDGVPDISDAEPFSSKNAKVDASGKEIINDVESKAVTPVKVLTRDKKTKTSSSPKVPAPKKNTVKEDAGTIDSNPVSSSNTEDASLYQNYSDLPSIYFAFEDYQIAYKNYKTLDYIAKVMQHNPEVNFIIIGNCDGNGSVEYNNYLGRKRAESVKNYLVSKFNIKSDRLSVSTLGKINLSTGGNSINRRVDIKVKE